MKTTPNGPLVCAYGEVFAGPHPLCEDAGKRMAEQFQADVKAGTYDTFGFTPNERKAQTKRLQQLGRLF